MITLIAFIRVGVSTWFRRSNSISVSVVSSLFSEINTIFKRFL